ncbi:MAG: VWA domain-containing protein, partial [Deltaproteobacteria bacterium]
ALAELEARLAAPTRELLRGDARRLAERLRRAALEAHLSQMEGFLQQGHFARRVAAGAGADAIEGDLELIRSAWAELGLDAELVARIDRLLAARIHALYLGARALVTESWRSRQRALAGLAGQDLLNRPLHALTQEEIERMKEVVEALARRLKERLGRRRRRMRRGNLDAHRTSRRSLRYDGLPLELVYRRRPRHRPDLVLLVDVSDSVRNVARFFLHLTWTLQEVFERVRSFVFVSDLGEATPLLKEADVHRAVDLSLTGRVVSLYANSNYGRAFAEFHARYLGAVGPRTTVIVLGDGRNNRNPSGAAYLADIKRRARRVVWLCPEPRRSWGFGDSLMPTYAKHCDLAEPVITLGDLARVAERILG